MVSVRDCTTAKNGFEWKQLSTFLNPNAFNLQYLYFVSSNHSGNNPNFMPRNWVKILFSDGQIEVELGKTMYSSSSILAGKDIGSALDILVDGRKAKLRDLFKVWAAGA